MTANPQSSTPSVRTIDDVIVLASEGKLQEHRYSNIELKEDWAEKHGAKLSALANKISELNCFLVIGIADNGNLGGKSEAWAKKTEENISQHINTHLDPPQSCGSFTCKQIGASWIIIIPVRNVGEVAYWDGSAYMAAGTTTAEMEPEKILKLRMQLPGLLDFSNQESKSSYNGELVAGFAACVRTAGHPLEVEITGTKEYSVLNQLNMVGRQAARILFGRCSFRIVRYDSSGEILENNTQHGLFRLLQKTFIDSLCGNGAIHYSPKALKEAFANAVAHAAYFENDGEVLLEIYPDRLVISNLCLRESQLFANRWFSRSHKTVNGLLMESLRVARLVDELGRGKHIIFSESIRLGHMAPEVLIETAGKYRRWKLVIHGGQVNGNLLRLLERSRELYMDEAKALIAQALVLWREKPAAEIRQFVDDEFGRMFADVIARFDGPIFYSANEDRIVLTRWARVLLEEGQYSQVLSPGEEERLFERLKQFCTQHENGIISSKLFRDFAGMSDTRSEQAQCSAILKRWVAAGRVQRLGRGRYQICKKAPIVTPKVDEFLRLFLNPKADSIASTDGGNGALSIGDLFSTATHSTPGSNRSEDLMP